MKSSSYNTASVQTVTSDNLTDQINSVNMKTNFIIGLSIFLNFLYLTAGAQNRELKLWYDKPSGSVWEAALPLGNGRLAAMVYGNSGTEIIKLNESSIWSGGPSRNDPADALSALPKVRRLIFDGKYAEASKLAAEKIRSNKNNGMRYQLAGDLMIDFPGHDHAINYRRELDLNTAVATTTYLINGVSFKRTAFVSLPDQVMVIQLTAGKAASINCSLSMSSLQRSVVTSNGKDELTLTGISGDKDGVAGAVKFALLTKVKIAGGVVSGEKDRLSVSGANSVTVFVSIGTNFINYHDISADEMKRSRSWLSAASGKAYPLLLKDHVKAYQHYFNRVSLDLGTNDSSHHPTDIRVRDFATGVDPQLVELYFQFGRYLLISSSQPGGQPANLQGIWNDKINPPWGSKYTININTEMNYWPAEVTNLTEMHEPLAQMVRELSQTGQATARNIYGARGWVAHHNTDLWRITGPVDGIGSAMWPTGGVWLTRQVWEKYLFSGDRKFLSSIYPAIKGAAAFCLDFLTEEPTHKWLVIAPSMSPENSPGINKGIWIAAGATMDNQLVFELLSIAIQASDILKLDKNFADTLRATRKRLPPMQIGQHSQLQEWLMDWDNPADKHRHVSHLYGLYPGNEISPYRTPELFSAAKTSLLQRGDISTGWSMGWKVNLWARFLDGDHAYQLIKNQLTPAGLNKGQANSGGGTYTNLFDAHPPFQIDGNFGCAAGIAEMLVQSHDGDIFLLPALPVEWDKGSVKGLRVRGGFTIESMEWESGKLSRVIIRSSIGGNCRIRVADELQLQGSGQLVKAKGNNPNPLFEIVETPSPLISERARITNSLIKETMLYDLDTKAGKAYTLIAIH
jgi:alpha-L-fucosidase 2